MKKIGLLLFLFLLVSLYPASGKYKISGSYTSNDNTSKSFSSFEGTPLLLEAISTTCDHCKEQNLQMDIVYNSLNESVSMLSLSINSKDNITTMNAYNQSYPMFWEYGIVDLDQLPSYEIKYTPTMILFDDNGNFANCWVGETESSVLLDEINTFLEDPTTYIDSNADGAQCKNPRSTTELFAWAMFFIAAIYLVPPLIRRFKKRNDTLNY